MYGFIQGNGNNLTFNLSGASGGYMWFISSVLDNVPTVTLANGNSNIVVQSMNFGGTTLTTTGATVAAARAAGRSARRWRRCIRAG